MRCGDLANFLVDVTVVPTYGKFLYLAAQSPTAYGIVAKASRDVEQLKILVTRRPN